MPIIQVNNSTGSDTAASGAGPTVALTGSSASTSATGLVVTLDGSPDLTNVLTDGSHVLWLNTASGRQFGAITAKDNTAKTVTTTTAYAASLTGRSWAIGGKRATLDDANTRKVFSADGAGWTVDPMDGTYPLTSTLNIAVSGLTIASSTTTRATITTSVNSMVLLTLNSGSGTLGLTLRHLTLSHTAATRGTGIYPSTNLATGLRISDCILDGFAVAIDGSFVVGYAFPNLLIEATTVKNGTGTTCILNNNNQATTAIDCAFLDNAGTVFSGMSDLTVLSCDFARNLRAVQTSAARARFVGNTVQGQTATGSNAAVEYSGSSVMVAHERNVFYGNAGTGVLLTMNANMPSNFVNRWNAYGGNGTDRSGIAAGTGDITLTADPFTNAAGNDFTLNSAAGGGALVKGVVNNVLAPGLAGTAHGDVGPYQSASSSSGGGKVLRSSIIEGLGAL